MQTFALSYPAMHYDAKKISLLVAGFSAAIVGVLATAPLMPSFGRSGGGGRSVVFSSLVYSFNSPGILNEAGSMQESTSPYWWLNSGGELIMLSGAGETMQGDAPPSNRWRITYALSNPLDTDGGLHPQNLFRLVSKSTWENTSVEGHFYIAADQLSASPNRNQSNGLLLMNRYSGDGQTLYYAGLRVDGTAVIKKKYKGAYYTLAQTQVFPGTYSISAATGTSQDLLPHKQWIGLRSSTLTNLDGSVTITLYQQSQNGSWVKLLQTTDTGDARAGKTPPIVGAHYIGIRTDFMDVQFSNIRIVDSTP